MGLKWGIFFRMRRLVVDSNTMLKEIHASVTNDIPHKLDDHEQHLKAQDVHMEAQDKRIGHIERALQIEVNEK